MYSTYIVSVQNQCWYTELFQPCLSPHYIIFAGRPKQYFFFSPTQAPPTLYLDSNRTSRQRPTYQPSTTSNYCHRHIFKLFDKHQHVQPDNAIYSHWHSRHARWHHHRSQERRPLQESQPQISCRQCLQHCFAPCYLERLGERHHLSTNRGQRGFWYKL
jgi:Pyruvate/2-oxoacid:ferredoxin oxidoreductase delta subunit